MPSSSMWQLSIKALSLNTSGPSKISDGKFSALRRNSQSGGILPPQALNATTTGIKTY